MYATEGKYAEADAVILKNKCSNVSFVAARQYGVDPSGAEQLLRANADKEDLARGLAEMVKAAAEKGNIGEALRFLGDVQSLGGPDSVSSEVHELRAPGPFETALRRYSDGHAPDRPSNSEPGLS